MGRLVDAALRFPGLVLAFALGLLGVGLYCYTQLDVEAYPNPGAPKIGVTTQPQGLSACDLRRHDSLAMHKRLVGIRVLGRGSYTMRQWSAAETRCLPVRCAL